MVEAGKRKRKIIYTLGHSTLAYDAFLKLLRQVGIQILVDVRTWPHSQAAPQFNQDNLAERLPSGGITYHHLKELGGKDRKARNRSPNTGLPKKWQGYADYMLTEEFGRGLTRLLALAAIGRVGLMCAEADWSQCHRRFLADALVARGYGVVHLSPDGQVLPHELSGRAEIHKDQLIYPAPGEQLSLF